MGVYARQYLRLKFIECTTADESPLSTKNTIQKLFDAFLT